MSKILHTNIVRWCHIHMKLILRIWLPLSISYFLSSLSLLTFSDSVSYIKLTLSIQCQIFFRKAIQFNNFFSEWNWIESKRMKLGPCQFILIIFWIFREMLSLWITNVWSMDSKLPPLLNYPKAIIWPITIILWWSYLGQLNRSRLLSFILSLKNRWEPPAVRFEPLISRSNMWRIRPRFPATNLTCLNN